jgi:hypothetical protein
MTVRLLQERKIMKSGGVYIKIRRESHQTSLSNDQPRGHRNETHTPDMPESYKLEAHT